MPDLHPALDNPAASYSIALALNDELIGPALILIESILAACSKDHEGYHFFILHTGISETLQNIMENYVSRRHAGIDFIKINETDFTIDYCPLLIPQIFKEWKRILYLDPAMLALGDIRPLFDLISKKDALAASNDYFSAALMPDYCRYILDNNIPENYFNANLILFNPENISGEEILSSREKIGLYKISPLQDILNNVYKQRISYLPQDVNFTLIDGSKDGYMPLKKKYTQERQKITHPLLVYYGGKQKPWRRYSKDETLKYAFYTPYQQVTAAVKQNLFLHKKLKISLEQNAAVFNHILSAELENELHIVAASDALFLFPSFVTFQSVLDHLPPEKLVNFYLLHNGIPEENQHILTSALENERCHVHFLDCRPMLEQYPAYKKLDHIILQKSLMVFAPTLLQHLPHLILIEGDMLVREDISKLLELSKGHPFSAVFCMSGSFLDANSPRFNGGLKILYNASITDEERTKLIALGETAKPSYEELYYNFTFQHNVHFLPLRWNSQILLFSIRKDPTKKEWKKEWEEAKENPAIVHYMGPKPWDTKKQPFFEEYAEIWERFREKTAQKCLSAIFLNASPLKKEER